MTIRVDGKRGRDAIVDSSDRMFDCMGSPYGFPIEGVQNPEKP